MTMVLLSQVSDTLPQGVMYTAVGGLCGAVGYVFRLLIKTHETRYAEIATQLSKERDAAQADRKEAREDRKEFLQVLSTEREKDRDSRHKDAQVLQSATSTLNEALDVVKGAQFRQAGENRVS